MRYWLKIKTIARDKMIKKTELIIFLLAGPVLMILKKLYTIPTATRQRRMPFTTWLVNNSSSVTILSNTLIVFGAMQ